ncbi:MAG: outer membrane lipoprotein-sorting protein [Kiritimatiellia bacterium]
MRTFLRAGWMLAVALGVGPVRAEGADPSAGELMERVRLSMPDVPLELEAAIRVLDGNGRPLKTVQAAAVLTPKEGGRTARYTLFDAFGSGREEMTVALGGGRAEFSFARGDPPRAAPLPDLFGPIEGSEISWMELSFSYFWWPEPKIVGTEKVANRWECQVIEIPCPPEYGGGWSHVRLWVAPAYHAVVRGEAWRDGKAAKRFEVKSVKKLRQIYMIGDMEVKNLETGARARLKVGRMKMLAPDYAADELEQFNAPIEW